VPEEGGIPKRGKEEKKTRTRSPSPSNPRPTGGKYGFFAAGEEEGVHNV